MGLCYSLSSSKLLSFSANIAMTAIWIYKFQNIIFHFHLHKYNSWQYATGSTHNAVGLSAQLYGPSTGNSFQSAPWYQTDPRLSELKGSLLNSAIWGHRDYVQCLNGACVKMVGVQRGSPSHTLQHSTGLCRSDPRCALADIQRAKMKVRIFHSSEDGYVIISVAIRSPATVRGLTELLQILREINPYSIESLRFALLTFPKIWIIWFWLEENI